MRRMQKRKEEELQTCGECDGEIKRNLNSSETIRNLNVEAAKLMNKGCDGILIACTEFSLLSQKISNKNLTDTLDCLTKAAISKALY